MQSADRFRQDVQIDIEKQDRHRKPLGSADPLNSNEDLRQFIFEAIRKNDAEIKLAGRSGKKFKTPLFTFVRHLQQQQHLRDLGAESTMKLIEKVMGARWSWTDSFPVNSDDEAELEFIDVWGKIRYQPGQDPLQQAVEKADSAPLSPPPGKSYNKLQMRFLSIAGYLQVSMGARNILLPVNKLDKILNISATIISQLRQFAEREGLLKKIKPHIPSAKATEFRFNVSRFKILADLSPDCTAECFGDEGHARAESILPESLRSARFKEVWRKWKKYHREQRGSKLSKMTMELQLKRFAEWGEDKAIRAIEASIKNKWIGCFDPDEKARDNSNIIRNFNSSVETDRF